MTKDLWHGKIAKIMIEVSRFLQETLGKIPEGHPDRQGISSMLTDAQKYISTRSFPEQLPKPITWSDEEREVLVKDGTVLYLPTGETINGQRQNNRPFWYVAGGYVIDGRNRLLDFPSRPIEIAIYPDPERFFVPGSFDKSKARQEDLILEDRDQLRKRTGLENLDQILPEASEATERIFDYLDKTGIRLLGQDYGYRWLRTNTPTNKFGSRFADVGYFLGVDGLRVGDFSRDRGAPDLGAARWVVPAGNR